MAPKFEYNLIVIGAGSGGLVSAYLAASLKAKVLLIEKERMGGDCLNTGCVPSKAIIKSASILSLQARHQEFGFNGIKIEYDFAKVMERIQRVIQKVEPHDSVERYSSLGVECLKGEAKILSKNQVSVNGKIYKTKAIIIATGARPLVPAFEGLNEVPLLTSDNIWKLRDRPDRLLVLGGGPIGSELAQSFQRLGSQVIQMEKAPRIMFREDPDVPEIIQERFKKEGIQILTNTEAKKFFAKDGKYFVEYTHSGKTLSLEFDKVLFALGRKPFTQGVWADSVNLKTLSTGHLEVDAYLQTSVQGIYAAGDIIGPYQFTHMAAHQAYYAAINALFGRRVKVDYSVVPWCTFTDPEVARVGLSEFEAKLKNIPYEITHYDLSDLDRAIADEEDHGFVKVLTPPGKDRILGVTIVGSHAGDLLSEFVLAMRHGLGLQKILGTTHIYPTMAEANKYAAGTWKRNHSPAWALKILQKFHNWRRA